jgi:YVTN family beta-propeller protein
VRRIRTGRVVAGALLLAAPAVAAAAAGPFAAIPSASAAPALAVRAAVLTRPAIPLSPVAATQGSVTGNTATIPVGRLPTSVAVDPVRGTVWVVNSADNTVSEISVARRTVIATIGVGVSPVDVAVDQKTATVWVTCLGPYGDPAADNTVSEISEASGKVIATIKVGRAPFGIAADSHTGTVWVANSGSDTVSEILEAHRAVVATISTSQKAPVDLAADPATGVVWVAELGGQVEEINEARRAVTATVSVSPGAEPNTVNSISVDTGTGVAWVARDYYTGGSYSGYASSIVPGGRLRTGYLVTKPAWYTDIPAALTVDPATRTVWVAENGANTLTLVSEGSGVARSLGTGDSPVAVAVDSADRTVWVVNNYDGTVTEYSYAAPQFTNGSQYRLTAGTSATIHVHTRGFPISVMSVSGPLPPGLKARLGAGTVVISGTPGPAARNHTYRVTVSADNGVSGSNGAVTVTQQLVITVGG